MPNTTNYTWVQPVVGADTGAWGTELNDTLQSIDSRMRTVEDEALAALPKAGGALTGRVDAVNGTVAVLAMGNVTGNTSIDCSKQYLTATVLSGAISWSFLNVPASGAYGIMLRLTNGGAGTHTWPAAVKWGTGGAPTLSGAATDLVTFITDDGGATWRGYLVAKGFAS